VVVDVIDASNLERNLYLAVQIMEMQAPMAIALNMTDVAKKRGFKIDLDKLSELLGAPVVPTIGNKGEGVQDLLAACAEVAGQPDSKPAEIRYGHEVDQEINELGELIARTGKVDARFLPRWAAVKLIEGDPAVEKAAKELCGEDWESVAKAAKKAIHAIESHFNEDASVIIAERRYGFAAGVVKRAVELAGEARQRMTDQIDVLVCNKVLGPAILVGVVAALFFFVFKISDEWNWIPWFGGWTSPTGLMEWIFESLSGLIAGLEPAAPVLHSLIDDGIIGGVGGVMGFVPLIFAMFLFISALEDTGYIARVAFILDRLLRAFGLQGKSILSMIVSGGLGAGGCAVPGVLATRTLREEKDRLTTMLVTPFMNCGAKMPVYAMLIAAFFSGHRTQMMVLLWAISWTVALCAAWILRKTVIKGPQTPFVMELPPYHVPTARGVLTHTWERTWLYVKKAGTIILAVSIVLWALMFFPRLPEEQVLGLDGAELTGEELASKELAYSFAGRLGTAFEPASQLAGFEWRTNIALIGGFAAKEVVVGALGTAYSMGNVDPEESESLSARLAGDSNWSPLKAFTLMIFVMIYAPCFVTISVIRKESGSWKWAAFSTLYSTSAAFILAVMVYQAGLALGLSG